MSNSAANAYARVASTTTSPRDIEAQALLKAANKLRQVVTGGEQAEEQAQDALMFNRKLWSIFVSDALKDENQNTASLRQEIVNIGIFVLSHSAALQKNLQIDQFQPLIDINCNLAAGLSGRA